MEHAKSRITVVESIYHQEFDGETTRVESRYSREVQSDEQVYKRKLTATEEWQPLDTGWITEAGMLHIENLEGKSLLTIPTEEEKEETAKKVLLISHYYEGYDMSEGSWTISPGETLRGTTNNIHDLHICSEHGPIKFMLTLYPK